MKKTKTNNFYLIGHMGAGKTTTGKILAKKSKLALIDTDNIIEQRVSMNIKNFFLQFTIDEFRKLEAVTLRNISRNSNQIVSTGGGIVLEKKNIDIMRATGLILYLQVTVRQQYHRLKHCTERPLLATTTNRLATFKEMAKKRNKLYEQAAHHTINTVDDNYIEQILSLINV